jgi:hypothetical protein
MNIYNLDYRMMYSLRQHLWPVLCQKRWHYNMYINNYCFVNKLSTFVFQNITIVIHCNSILNEIQFLILHSHIITWKWQEQGPFFQLRRGPKEFFKHHCPEDSNLHTHSRENLKSHLSCSTLSTEQCGSWLARTSWTHVQCELINMALEINVQLVLQIQDWWHCTFPVKWSSDNCQEIVKRKERVTGTTIQFE